MIVKTPDNSIGPIIKGSLRGLAVLGFALNLAFSPKPPPSEPMCNEVVSGKTISFQVGAHRVEHTLPNTTTGRLIPCFQALQRLTQ